MAGGAFVNGAAAGRAAQYEYKITPYFIFACIVAASGGALFGYDLGVSGQFSSSSSSPVLFSPFPRFFFLSSLVVHTLQLFLAGS